MPSDRDRERDAKLENGDNKEERKDICRDFLNNICTRGHRCRFFHPEGHTDKAQNAADEPYQFCIDFQNQGCHRDNCRFVHALREDVERYKRSGDVTLGLARALAALLKGDSINGIPLCKEFQNGHCARGSQCRYWHINRDEERRKRFAGRGEAPPLAPLPQPQPLAFGAYPPPGRSRRRDDFAIDDFGPPQKRSFVQTFVSPLQPSPISSVVPQPPTPTHVIVELERRNAELNAEVESLKRELQREKERYDDLMSLFRATQGQQQPQRSSLVGSSNSNVSAISSLGALQQQPGVQQWGTSSIQPSWSKYEWSSN